MQFQVMKKVLSSKNQEIAKICVFFTFFFGKKSEKREKKVNLQKVIFKIYLFYG